LNPQASAASYTAATLDATSQTLGTFNYIDDLYYSKRSQAINGARGIYFPLDERYTQFLSLPSGGGAGLVAQPAASWNVGFYIAFYGANLPPSAQCLRLDFFIDVEATVQPAYNNYIPQSPAAYATEKGHEKISKALTADKVLQASSEIPIPVASQSVAASGWGSDILNWLNKGLKAINKSGLLEAAPFGISDIAQAVGKGVDIATQYVNNSSDSMLGNKRGTSDTLALGDGKNS